MVLLFQPSVADGLLEELVARDVARSPEDCVADAWALGQEAIAAWMTQLPRRLASTASTCAP